MMAVWTFNLFVLILAAFLFGLIWHASKPRKGN